MIDQGTLQDQTEFYLKAVIADASGSPNRDFDSFAAFGELGVNSFYVLKILRQLEADFGRLPKSLLFENFTIHDLAKYFVDQHESRLQAILAAYHPGRGEEAPAVEVLPPAAVQEAALSNKAEPICIRETDARTHPELKDVIEALFNRYKLEGSVSRGTHRIAPYLFIGSARKGYFHYSRCNSILLVYGYTGPREYAPELVEEIYRYCQREELQLNLLSDEDVSTIGGVSFTATPFGVLQRITNLKSFTLEGGTMRRLRYQVAKFQKSGACVTEEYRCGSDPDKDQQIVSVIDRWSAAKTMVNPLVRDVREEILFGKLAAEHRLFLTHLDGVLQNVILITAMCPQVNGYLMDLEFYPPEMPMGGLEFAIVQVIEALAAEGCDVLSLGGTYGCKFDPSPNADPEIEKILDDLRLQNVFNDEGNLQFKSKFRPEAQTLYLCRPTASGRADNVIDIIMMIADPDAMQASGDEDQERAGSSSSGASPEAATIPASDVIPSENRSGILSSYGFNPLNLPYEHVDCDLKTDSWSQLHLPAIDVHISHLHAQLQQPVSVAESVRSVFPFAHFVLTESGQAAEHVFFKAWPKKGVVLQNLLFPSTIFHEFDNGFTAVEQPHQAIFELRSRELYRGNLDLQSVRAHIDREPEKIAFVCIEVANNAAGGSPVSLQHLKEIKASLAVHSIPLVMDVTRIVENAQFLIEQETDCAGKSIWTVVKDILSYADVAIGSLTKDFCVSKGGIIATNDPVLFHRMREIAQNEDAGVDLIDQKMIALALQNRKQIEVKVLRRVEAVRLVWQALQEHNIPVVSPAGGHCVLIDTKQVPELKDFTQRAASLLAWLYLETGIRGSVHSVGMQKATPINDLVRLAIPVGLKRDQVDDLTNRLIRAFGKMENIPELVLESAANQATGSVFPTYRLVRYHQISTGPADSHAHPVASAAVAATGEPKPVSPPETIKAGTVPPTSTNERRRAQDIAIIGMAGRFPKAKNPQDLWNNLVAGRDCIEEIPADRYEALRLHGATRKYRGGFIDDVDKFDSLFFNISPREAEMLDPQERLFLEVAWEAVEDAGYYPEVMAPAEARDVGVFVGAVWTMYQMLGVEEKHRGNKIVPNSFLWTIANRVSYWMNLSGPSLTVDTACSSSLTAIYLACAAIRAGDCSAAIVGGVNLDLHPAKFEINATGGALSKDGVCRSFGKGANGYVAGEGVGALLLKPLDRAVADGDNIYGVIKSAVVNHGGRTSGYTVPNPRGQAALIVSALEKAEISAESIGYVEAHGTGTELGDPIEITGLSNAFRPAQTGNQVCAIGSVKSNIGHLEAAAGVVSVCKVLLQMKHRQLVPSLHSSEVNEFIDFEHSPFYVVQRLEAWKEKVVDGKRLPLRAAISSFGAGGANAHVILEEYVREQKGAQAAARPGALIFPLSAKNEEQLRQTASRLLNFLQQGPVCFSDVAYTLQVGRKSFDHRLAIVASTSEELNERLRSFLQGKTNEDILAGHVDSSHAITRLLDRREREEFLRILMQRRAPRKLAGLWVEGLLPDWQGLQTEGAGTRISLPTYPFADRRHWAFDRSQMPRQQLSATSAKEMDADGFAELYYASEWESAPLGQEKIEQTSTTMLLFAADETLREIYQARYGQQAVLVQPGPRFQETGRQSYTIQPSNKQDFLQLFSAIAEKGYPVRDICFAWPLSDSGMSGEAPAEKLLDMGIYPFLFACQSIAKHGWEGNVRLLYVFAGQAGESQPHHQAVAGFVNALRLEHPKLFAKTVEVCGDRTGYDQILEAIVAEFGAKTQDANAVLYEAGERSIKKLKPLNNEEFALASTPGMDIREKGVYLITGGAGGLGLIFAEWLARDYQAKLILTGRSRPSVELETRLHQLRQAGAEVLYLAADISNQQAALGLVKESKRRFGNIHGVIHAAGVLRDSLIRHKTAEEMSAVFAPKVDGTLNLDQATREENLDFFVTFSSLAAVAGSVGQSDYCYANHFMDSFAAQRERLRARGERSGRTLSLNWSLWSGGGMKVDEPTEAYFRKNLGIRPLSAETGRKALLRGLHSSKTQFAVLEGVQEKVELAWGLRKKELPAAPAYEVAAQPGQDEERMVLWLRDELSQIVMRLLKLEAEDVAPDKILLDLGFDSIGLTTFADAVNEKFKLDLTPVLFFDYPSIDEIARHLSIERKADILAAYRSSAHPVSEAPSTGNARLSAPASPVGASYVSEPHSGSVPIAVIGMSGVLPQSDDLEEFWDHLKNGRDLVTVIPRDRWHWEDFWGDPLKETNKSNSKWGGFMKEVDKFDSLFFGISPREAQSMDPQQRILLETLWKAIEDAGVKVSELSGTKTGIFVGASTHDYLEVMKALDVPLDGYSASGNSHSVLANRASFLLNLRGPSAPIDTASSSSLVALHRAVESLQSGSCDMAIAGGVEVMLSPVAYISFSMAGMLSADGKCKAFDKRANGYVRAEGCGLVFLKPLQAAEADGNHIYGVIRSSAENHGGRVSTMTAPNAAAQTALLVEAYEKAQIDPATVGYIEAHGTGTSLGDPIEVQALSKAFAELYKKHGKALSGVPHCALSSVKTNIGHLETAAGIAGVLKVLLALKYKQIPANIHFEELNPYIQLKQSPFYIADRLTPWEAPVAADGSRLPRRAGVSSFGFGGSNAHVVIEEYTPPPRHLPAGTAEPCVFVLSAKNADRLHAYVAAMLHCLQNTQLILQDLAYTLQVGRDEMPERLACVVSSVEELEQRLGSILKGAPPTGGTYRNNIKSKEAKALAADGIEILVQSLLDQRELARVAELWTAGARVDWQSLYGDQLPRRIPLPTYPFARERHWVRGGAVEEKQVPAENVLLHPLVQRNLSTAEANRFTSTFSGDEFFLRDHVVQKQMILPGVAYLEMIRAAGELAQKTPVRVIRNLLWERPLIVGSNAEQVEVSLTPFQSEVKFLVSTGGKNKPVVHCSGKLAYVLENPGPEVMDVQAIQNRCRDEIVTGEDLYPLLNASGLSYGGTFQTIQRICANGTESLAIVQLKKEAREEADRFYLHPGLMDGALHAIFGLVKKNGLDIPLNLPSSVGEVQIFGPLTDLYFAHAAWVDDDARSNPSILKVNLHLLDRNGKVLVCMKDFVARPIQRSAPAAASAPPVPERPKNEAKTLLQSLASVWKPVQLEAEARITLPQSANVLLIAGDEQLLAWLRTDYPNAQILRLDSGTGIEAIAQKLSACTFDQLLWLAPDVGLPNGRENQGSEDIIAEQEAGVLLVFRITKALLQLGYANKKLGWTLVTSRTQAVTEAEVIQPTHAGIVGLVGSLAKEYAQWNIRLLDLDSLKSVTAQHCLTLPWEKQGNALAYRDGKWWQQGLEVIQALSSGTPLYRQEGVYVVIGGAGGLGEVWSKFMMEKYQANIVWIGRRPYDAVIEEKLLNSLTRLGRAPLYVAADAADPESLQQAYETIVSTYPSIHGVVHSAIVLHDQSISRMDEAGFRAGFSAKVDVMVNMDRVFGKQDLDFMLVFSSIISFFKTPGQCNYAAGCTFKDSFALHLHSARGYETKILNWGYWGSVGVAADDFHRKVMEQMGMGSIEPREGMELLEAFIASPLRQVAVIKTLERQAAQGLSVSDAITQHKERLAKNTPGKSASAAADGSTSDASIRQIITEKLSEALYIDADKIPCDTPFSEFGVDSIIGVNLVRSINETLGIDLPMEVLFERTTVAELAELIAKTEKSSGSAIQPADRSQFERLPLSFAQERVWFFEQFEPDSVRYNLPQAITVTGELDVDQLERAFNLIIARHENLRTVFPSEDGEAQQLILNSLDFRLDRVDLTHLQDKQTRTTQAKAVCQAEATRAFDLARGPLLRGQVIKLAEQEHIVLLNMHHIVSDGWSLGVLMRELDLILEAFHQGRTPDLPPLPIQYADYSIWQRDWLKQDERLQRQLAYWQNKLAALPESLPLPTDYPRPWVRSFAGASHSFTFDPQLSRQLKSVAEQRGGTLFMVLLTAFNILLHRYTEQVDISVGSLIANRQYEETQGLIGMFVNTLVLRNQVEGEDTFSSLFSQVKATCLEAYENQDAPFEKVVDLFRSQRDQAVNPLFQVMFILQNAALGKLDQRYPPYSFDNDLSEFDLTLQLFETADGLTGTIDYATMLYKPETIARMAGHLIGLCQVIVATPAIKICDIRYLSAAEEQLLTIGFNQTKAHYPSDKCLHEHFAEQASVDSERPAVVVAEDGEEAGYSQLYHKSSELALYLRSLGVAPESVVGLCADGAVDFAVGILGILRAGGACLPLDPTSLDDQIAYMLQDSQVDVVLTEEKFSNRLRPLTRQHAKLIMLDEPWPEIATSVDTLTVQGALSGNDVAPHHTAYVMYALGATGKPTGVLLDHQSVMNRIYGLQQRYSLNPQDVVMSGDLSMWELFWTVMAGATLVVPAPGAHKNVRSLTELINRRKVTTLHCTPSTLSKFLQNGGRECASVKRLLCRGEGLDRSTVDRYRTKFPSASLYSHYGQTEAMDVTAYDCAQSPASFVPIGVPAANMQVHILDAHGQLQPIGVPGELHIAGDSLARGYLNRPEMTQQRFVANPFKPGSRMYKSTDRARWLDDGNLQYLGKARQCFALEQMDKTAAETDVSNRQVIDQLYWEDASLDESYEKMTF